MRTLQDRHHVGAPASGPKWRQKPSCADDGADVNADARDVLSNFTVLPFYLAGRSGYRSRDFDWVLSHPRGGMRADFPLPLWRGALKSRPVLENVDRPRPDQQRRSVLPAGVSSTSSTGNSRRARRDKAQRRGPASACDSRVPTPRPFNVAHLCTLGNPITRAARTSPQ
jgi:hypothetical protein